MTRLTSVHGSFSAHVLAARLQSEGFDVELRGALGGPYALTVGDLAVVEVLVPADQVEEASLVLLESEVEEALDDGAESPAGPSWGLRLVVAGVVATGLYPILRLAVGVQ